MKSALAISFAIFISLGVTAMAAGETEATAAEGADTKKEWPAALDFTMNTLDGEEVHLAQKYEGQVVLLVNVASKCGYTPQYTGLQTLHEKYGEQGLAVVGAPCNQFGGQEAGTSEDIAEFCEATYGVEFDMLEKVNVKRSEDDQCPLYEYLTDEEKLPETGSDIRWNFEKFLIGRDGQVIAHYRSKVAPLSKELTSAIEKALSAEAPASTEPE